MKEIERIQALSDAFGVSGMEDDVVDIIKNELKEFEMQEDHMRNVLVKVNDRPDGLKILLDAHSDEVGFIIQAIKENGLMRFLPIGGWDPKNIAGHKVMIKNIDGKLVEGIVCSKPPHFMRSDEKGKSIDFDSMFIDVGACSKEEVMNDYHIHIGCFALGDAHCTYQKDKEIFMGKAFDCRIGCAAVIEVLKRLINSDNQIYASFSTQEEVGERGMKCLLHQIEPDIMIAFEGCPADDSFQENYMIQAGLKRGVMLRHFDVSMITHPRFQRFAINIANKYNIKIQESVRKGGGTNGGMMHTHGHGVPCIVLGIPVRYAHSANGITSLFDYEQAIRLALALIDELNKEIVDQF